MTLEQLNRLARISDAEGVSSNRQLLAQTLEHSFEIFDCPELDGVAVRNAEKQIGWLKLPLVLPGTFVDPVTGREHPIVLATTEGALAASVARGLKVIRQSKIELLVLRKRTNRAPVFRVRDLATFERIRHWIQTNTETLEQWCSEGSHHLRFLSGECSLNGTSMYVDLSYDTDAAMGMNMVTSATARIADRIAKMFDSPCIAVSSNVCSDKKASARIQQQGRGRSIIVQATIPEETIHTILHCSIEQLIEVLNSKLYYSAPITGTLGFNCHLANMISAFYIATGQDPAQTVEGSLGYVHSERQGTKLQLTVTLPAIMVGAIGGGTALPPQRTVIDLITHPLTDPRERSDLLARAVAVTCVAGELSLLAALATNDLARAHNEARERPLET